MTNTTYNNNKTIVHSMVRVQQLLIKQWFSNWVLTGFNGFQGKGGQHFFPEAKLI